MVDSDDDPDYALAVNYSVRTGILEEGHQLETARRFIYFPKHQRIIAF